MTEKQARQTRKRETLREAIKRNGGLTHLDKPIDPNEIAFRYVVAVRKAAKFCEEVMRNGATGEQAKAYFHSKLSRDEQEALVRLELLVRQTAYRRLYEDRWSWPPFSKTEFEDWRRSPQGQEACKALEPEIEKQVAAIAGSALGQSKMPEFDVHVDQFRLEHPAEARAIEAAIDAEGGAS
jgi:hypothetical protein